MTCVGRTHIIKEKGCRRLPCLMKQNQSQTVVQLSAQYNAEPSRNVSEHTVQWTLLDTGLCSRKPNHVPLLTKSHWQLCKCLAQEHCNWIMDLWKRFPCQMNHGLSFIIPMALSGHAIDRTQVYSGRFMLWGTFSWASLGPMVVVQQTLNATAYLNIIVDQLHLYMASVFSTGNGMLKRDNALRLKAWIMLVWFQEDDAEFELMF